MHYNPFMTKKDERVAVHVTEKAKNSTFINCDIIGGVKIEGGDTKMLGTRIIHFSKEYPKFWWSVLIGVVGFFADLISIVTTGMHFWQWLLR